MVGSRKRKEIPQQCEVDARATIGAADIGIGSTEDGFGLLTYERRKKFKTESKEHFPSQDSQEMPRFPKVSCHDCSVKQNRRIVLAQLCQSLEGEGGLKSCIQGACGAGNEDTSHSANMVPNGSSHDLVTESTMLKLLNSDGFTDLCSLLVENGINAGKLMDFSHVDLRMKEKAYERSPLLLHSDMQEVWKKLQKVGTDMVAIAKSVADQTLTSFHGQMGSASNGISTIPTFEESSLNEVDIRGTSNLDDVLTCRQCREKTDGKNCLVCDSCEEMYHISCIKPAVKEIPSKSWYCTNCARTGIESPPHEDCVACERLETIASSSPFNANEFKEAEEQQKDHRSNENPGSNENPQCKICKTEVKNKQDHRICGHSLCPHKFYHAQCLTSQQLASHGPCWYCPSCLCICCFVDKDDDKIVMCDGCDDAYHMYCMDPPRTTVPKGKWFCKNCCEGMDRIAKARRSFEGSVKKCKKGSSANEALSKSGGVHMLLNAAKTLNCGEN